MSQSFLLTWPSDLDTATATIPVAMSDTSYLVDGAIQDIPSGGSAAELTFPTAGRTTSTFTVAATGILLTGTTIALTVEGATILAGVGAIDWDDVIAFAPELVSVSTGAQTDILNYVNCILAVACFGGETSVKTRLARIYLAAHMGKLVEMGGEAADGISMERAGGLMRQYGTGGADKTSLQTTAFGKLFLQLIRASGARGPILL